MGAPALRHPRPRHHHGTHFLVRSELIVLTGIQIGSPGRATDDQTGTLTAAGVVSSAVQRALTTSPEGLKEKGMGGAPARWLTTPAGLMQLLGPDRESLARYRCRWPQ